MGYVRKNFVIDEELAEALKKVKNQSELLRTLLRKHLFEPPERFLTREEVIQIVRSMLKNYKPVEAEISEVSIDIEDALNSLLGGE